MKQPFYWSFWRWHFNSTYFDMFRESRYLFTYAKLLSTQRFRLVRTFFKVEEKRSEILFCDRLKWDTGQFHARTPIAGWNQVSASRVTPFFHFSISAFYLGSNALIPDKYSKHNLWTCWMYQMSSGDTLGHCWIFIKMRRKGSWKPPTYMRTKQEPQLPRPILNDSCASRTQWALKSHRECYLEHRKTTLSAKVRK